MSSVLAVTTGSPLWYFARATGMVALVLLTVTVVLGVVTSVRWASPRWPRFVVEYVHRDVTLLVMAFIALHVATVVLDGFAPIGWAAAVVPFSSPYRPLWLGLGAVGFDLLLAIGITSWLRHRVGFRVWRFVHWFAYGAWAFSIVHGLATGTDTQQGWALLVNAGCIAAVVAAVWWRLAVGWQSGNARIRTAVLGATFVLPLALLGWLRAGPLANGWARRSGTPASVLTKTTRAQATTAPSTSTPSTTTAPSSRSDDRGRSDDDGGFFDR